jgi:periplasmic protein TonB
VKARTVAVSLGIHVGIAVLALVLTSEDKKRRPTQVAVFEPPQKKVAAEPKPEPPRPPPPPVVEPPRPRVASAAPKPAPTPVAEPPPPAAQPAQAAPDPVTSTPGPSSDGPGLPVGPPTRPGPAAEPKPKVLERPKTEPKRAGEDNCTEPSTKPEPVVKTAIEYTTQARADGVEGRLVLKVTVAADGSVSDVNVVSSVEPSLDAAAVAAVKQWRFKASTRCGRSVAGGTYTLARRFELGD